MQKKLIIVFVLLTPFFVFSQTNDEAISVEEFLEKTELPIYEDNSLIPSDTLTYDKTIDYDRLRDFDTNLNNKYAGKDFEYIDNLKEKEPQKKIEHTNSSSIFAGAFLDFMFNIFPYLLVAIVVFIIIRSFVGIKISFWNFKKQSTKATRKLVYENVEEIDENDYNLLIKNAVDQKNYRLAVRYYYLALLKKLSQKECIIYHKDKTNSEYLFELKNKQIRSEFSYLAYIYDYVWYGEFAIDEGKFKVVQNKYNTLLNTL